MRYGLFILFLTTFAITVYGQESITNCPEVTLAAPRSSYPWDPVRISAKSHNSRVTGDWLVVRRNYRSEKIAVEKIKAAESIKVTAWNTNDSGFLTVVLSVPPSESCSQERFGAVYVLLTENPGSPLIIDEFGEVSLNEQKARLDAAIAEMKKRKDAELLVFLRFKKPDSGVHRRGKISQILHHVVNYRKFDIMRVTFVLSDENERSVQLRVASKEETDVLPYFPEYLVIRAEQFNDYKKLFR
jgi:hypothetical protein